MFSQVSICVMERRYAWKHEKRALLKAIERELLTHSELQVGHSEGGCCASDMRHCEIWPRRT